MDKVKTSPSASDARLVYSTTDGRQRFPDILQVTYGDKSVIGFDRYGRALGAVVPIEAVRILAGRHDAVDERLRDHIERAASALLAELGEPPKGDELVSPESVKAERQASSVGRIDRGKARQRA